MTIMMTDAEYQNIWDKRLLSSWTGDFSGWAIGVGFLKDVDSDLLEAFERREGDFGAISRLFISCNLSRCLDKDYYGNLEFRPSRTARAFVSEHCERLSTCLWSGKHTEEALLESINNFKWRKKGAEVIKATHDKSVKKQRTCTDVPIKLRSLSTKHDWNIVK